MPQIKPLMPILRRCKKRYGMMGRNFICMDILVHVTKFFDIAEYTGDAKNSGVLELGVNGNISEHWQVGAGVLAEVGDAPNAQTSVFVNTSYRF